MTPSDAWQTPNCMDPRKDTRMCTHCCTHTEHTHKKGTPTRTQPTHACKNTRPHACATMQAHPQAKDDEGHPQVSKPFESGLHYTACTAVHLTSSTRGGVHRKAHLLVVELAGLDGFLMGRHLHKTHLLGAAVVVPQHLTGKHSSTWLESPRTRQSVPILCPFLQLASLTGSTGGRHNYRHGHVHIPQSGFLLDL